MTKFYKPVQGDSARAVADGYESNFSALDAAKADAGQTSAALDDIKATASASASALDAAVAALGTKVDKAEGRDLMTAEERSKLAGIEGGANAYSLPAASAATLGGVRVGRNLAVSADGTLDAPDPTGLDPDNYAAAAEVSPADRLLAFSPSGEPQTATAAQLRAYATEEVAAALAAKADTETVNDALAGKVNTGGDATQPFNAQYFQDRQNIYDPNWNIGGVGYCGTEEGGKIHRFCSPAWFKAQLGLWHSGNFNPANASVGEARMMTSMYPDNDNVYPGVTVAARFINPSSGIIRLYVYGGGTAYYDQIYVDYANRVPWDGIIGKLTASASADGLMTAADKQKLDSQPTVIRGAVKTGTDTGRGYTVRVDPNNRRTFVTHNLGHADYVVILEPTASVNDVVFESKSANEFTVRCNSGAFKPFDFILMTC